MHSCVRKAPPALKVPCGGAPNLAERVQLCRLHGDGAQCAEALQAVGACCSGLARRRCRQCIHLLNHSLRHLMLPCDWKQCKNTPW